jgi:alkylation response protein AidB-like acyl-CoA dehydrogenase
MKALTSWKCVRIISILKNTRYLHAFSLGDDIFDLSSLSIEDVGLFKVALEFARQKIAPIALNCDNESKFPRNLMLDCGFGGLCVSKEYGGSAYSKRQMCLIVEALASVCVSTTALITIHNGTVSMMDRYLHPSLRQRWLPKLTSMRAMASFCLTEPGSGSDAASIVTQGVFDLHRQEYVLNGQKCFISGAGQSEAYLVAFKSSPDRISCAFVPSDTPGLSFGVNEKKMGWKSQPTRQVFFENVRVPAINLVGAEGQGFKIALSGLDSARLSISACSLGAASDTLQRAIVFVRENKITDQGVTFQLSDMLEKLHSSRLLLRMAADMMDSNSPAAPQYCALAKRTCTDTGSLICGEIMQILGREGLLTSNMVEKHWRDVRVHQILEGTNEIMRHIIGRSIVA